MLNLPNSCRAWRSESFAQTLKQELQILGVTGLPLMTTQGGHIDEQTFSVMVLATKDTSDSIEARVGVFFCEILAGCNCSDDPVASDAYGELIVKICKQTARTTFINV